MYRNIIRVYLVSSIKVTHNLAHLQSFWILFFLFSFIFFSLLSRNDLFSIHLFSLRIDVIPQLMFKLFHINFLLNSEQIEFNLVFLGERHTKSVQDLTVTYIMKHVRRFLIKTLI